MAGQSCQWSVAGAVLAKTDPRKFVDATRRALQAGATTVAGDCRELRIVVPSVPAEAKAVAGQVTATRTSPDGSQVSVTVAPRDRLVIGLGDFFTSGEGNPERLALFFGKPWTGGNIPARDPDPVSLAAKDMCAQWTDRWCHRSVYSWQIRTALDAALSDPHQSFTILPYGCSGATIMEGVLYGYNGVEWSAATDKGVVGSRSEIGLAYRGSLPARGLSLLLRPRQLNDGYHRVWGRDLYQQATGSIAADNSTQALPMAQFLWSSQFIGANTAGDGATYAAGSFPRYSPVSGIGSATAHDLGRCEQLDQEFFRDRACVDDRPNGQRDLPED